MLLVIACAMFAAHTASAGEIAAPMPIPACAAEESEAVSGDTMTVDMVVYEIMLAELKKDGISENAAKVAPARRLGLLQRIAARRVAPNPPPPPANAIDNSLVPFMLLEERGITGITFSASRDAIHTLLYAQASTNNLSVLSAPQVATMVGTPAHVITRNEEHGLEMKLLPVRLEDGKVFTEIVVERTEILNGKEVTNQIEISVNLPTDYDTSLITGRTFGDKTLLLIVRSHHWQDAVPAAVAQSIYDPQ